MLQSSSGGGAVRRLYPIRSICEMSVALSPVWPFIEGYMSERGSFGVWFIPSACPTSCFHVPIAKFNDHLIVLSYACCSRSAQLDVAKYDQASTLPGNASNFALILLLPYPCSARSTNCKSNSR